MKATEITAMFPDGMIETDNKRGELVIYTGLAYPLGDDGDPVNDDNAVLVPMRED